MNIVSYSNDGRVMRLCEYIEKYIEKYTEKRHGASDRSFYLLPIPSARDGVHITGTDEELSSLTQKCAREDVIVGYGIPPECFAAAQARGIYVLDAERDEKFTDENARLTAEGVLARLMSSSDVSVSEMKIAIIGLGRIGGRLCRMLSYLGAKVTAFSSKSEQDICADVLPYGKMQTFDYKSLDILINTAPVPLIDASLSDALSCVRVIELASGENIPRAIPYTRLSAVPSAMYPESAARVYVEFFGRCADLIF